MRRERKNLIYSILLVLPLLAFGFTFSYVQFTHIIRLESFTIQPEFTNGILSSYGIIIGFWAAIIGLSHSEHKLLWKNMDVVKLVFFVSLGMLVFCVFLFGFQAIGVLPSYVELFFSVCCFYLTCVFLGITLNEAILKNREIKW
jgi:hypothetical protein